jgi:hypothetical protein
MDAGTGQIIGASILVFGPIIVSTINGWLGRRAQARDARITQLALAENTKLTQESKQAAEETKHEFNSVKDRLIEAEKALSFAAGKEAAADLNEATPQKVEIVNQPIATTEKK